MSAYVRINIFHGERLKWIKRKCTKQVTKNRCWRNRKKSTFNQRKKRRVHLKSHENKSVRSLYAFWRKERCFTWWIKWTRGNVRSRNHCCCQKGRERGCVCVCVCVFVVLIMQHAKRVRLMSSAASLAPPYFSTFCHKRHDFRKNVTEYKMCILIFATAFVWNISHSKENSARYCHKCENVFMWSTRFSSGFNESWIFSTYFGKYSYQISWKSVQWEQSSMRTDGRTGGQTLRS